VEYFDAEEVSDEGDENGSGCGADAGGRTGYDDDDDLWWRRGFGDVSFGETSED